jgi:hypothetical protein
VVAVSTAERQVVGKWIKFGFVINDEVRVPYNIIIVIVVFFVVIDGDVIHQSAHVDIIEKVKRRDGEVFKVLNVSDDDVIDIDIVLNIKITE